MTDIKKMKSSASQRSYGSAREAFICGEVVLKLPNTKETFSSPPTLEGDHIMVNGELVDVGGGVRQTLKEWEVWEKCPSKFRYLLCPIIDKGYTQHNVPYTIMKKLTTFSKWTDAECEYCDVEALLYGNGYEGNEIDTIIEDCHELFDMFGLEHGDFYDNMSNWGKDEKGKVQLLDYGF